MESNKVSPKIQSIIHIFFLYFCFSFFCTNQEIRCPEARSCKVCGKSASFYSATDFNSRADFSELTWLLFLSWGDMDSLFAHFYFFFKCPVGFAFAFGVLQGIAFPYLKGRGNWTGNWCLNNDDKNEGHWDKNENWHLNCPLWFLNDLLWCRVLCCFS